MEVVGNAEGLLWGVDGRRGRKLGKGFAEDRHPHTRNAEGEMLMSVCVSDSGEWAEEEEEEDAEEEEEESYVYSGANAVNEEDPERDRAEAGFKVKTLLNATSGWHLF